MEDVVIWWLDQPAYELAEAFGAGHADWPQYIKNEFESRCGRPGNGRLWIASEIDFDGMEWGEGPAFAMIGAKSGGIVVRKSDANHILSWPGIVTDVHMKPLRIESFVQAS
ncbi:hypothetical protein OIU34_20315 [Pararhizobium sp. BT-229]|uniref:hypothetical protein n=1 Tax=Pararhizobium sp. BT-229 TaxID=2986923 RepID=UPI0021F722B7|nr:hypothetical protein [Pararhizobium sp. BT-229]MCV9964233.1 hypothetical protein [Pararhizobium sp. BT-229]